MSAWTPADMHLSPYVICLPVPAEETRNERAEDAGRPGANRAIGVKNLDCDVYLRSRIHLCASPSMLHEHVWEDGAGAGRAHAKRLF